LSRDRSVTSGTTMYAGGLIMTVEILNKLFGCTIDIIINYILFLTLIS